MFFTFAIIIIIIIIVVVVVVVVVGIQPLGRSGQRPEFSQATGMALVRCILGNFLGVACHCFPPLFRRSHFSPPGASTSATTYIYIYIYIYVCVCPRARVCVCARMRVCTRM